MSDPLNQGLISQIAIFASGTGSNAAKIIDHFREVKDINVSLIVCNKPGAGVLDIAEKAHIPSLIIERSSFYNSDQLLFDLARHSIDFIALAGFLWLIPPYLIDNFSNRILNIHPALLPKYGGKGMYGMHVHRAVKSAGEKKSGITVHLVNENFDEGAIIFQATCDLVPEDDADNIRSKVLELEHRYFAPIIENFIRQGQKRLDLVQAN